MKLRRLLSVISILLLVFAFGCNKSDSGSASLGGVDIKEYVAKDAGGFMVANLQAMATSGALDEITDEKAKKDIKEFEALTGLSIKKDLKLAVISILDEFKMAGGSNDPNMFIVITGNFEESKIMTAMKTSDKSEIEEMELEGLKVYHSTPKVATEKEGYMHFFDGEKIVFSNNQSSLLVGINTLNGKSPNMNKNEKLVALYDKVDKGHMFWGIFDIPVSEEDATGGMMPEFNNMRSVYFGGSYDGAGLNLDANMFMSDENSSKQIATKLEGFKAMFGPMLGEKPEVAELINNIKISQVGESVIINFSMTKAQMDQLKSMKDMGM